MAIKGLRVVKPGERLHQPLADYLLFQGGILCAFEKMNGGGVDGKPIDWNTHVMTVSRVADMNFYFPAMHHLHLALDQAPAEGIGISFSQKAVPASSVQNLGRVSRIHGQHGWRDFRSVL